MSDYMTAVLDDGEALTGALDDGGGLSGVIERPETIFVKEVHFNNRYEFPSIGQDNMLYVAKDEHRSYIFNPAALAYEVVGADYNEVKIIQGIL